MSQIQPIELSLYFTDDVFFHPDDDNAFFSTGLLYREDKNWIAEVDKEKAAEKAANSAKCKKRKTAPDQELIGQRAKIPVFTSPDEWRTIYRNGKGEPIHAFRFKGGLPQQILCLLGKNPDGLTVEEIKQKGVRIDIDRPKSAWRTKELKKLFALLIQEVGNKWVLQDNQ